MVRVLQITEWIGTAFIGAGRDFAYRKRMMRKLHDHYPGIWGFQGIDQADVGDEFTALWGIFHAPYRFAFAPDWHHDPEAFPSDWDVTGPDDGLSYVDWVGTLDDFRGLPRRAIQWTNAIPRFTEIPTLCFFNGQAPNWEDDGTPYLKERRRRWNAWWDMLRGWIDQCHRYGAPAFITMNAGRTDLPQLHRNARYLAGFGRDYVIGVGANDFVGVDIAFRKLASRVIALDIGNNFAHQAKVHIELVYRSGV